MSAYIVDPRTVDYIVAWGALPHRSRDGIRTGKLWDTWPEIPQNLRDAAQSYSWGDPGCYINLAEADETAVGQLLLDQNIRSVATRYPDCPRAELPGYGGVNVDRYRFRAVPHHRPEWVLGCIRCWRYQSCETEGWESTAAARVVDAIERAVIDQLCDDADAPWGITQHTLDDERAAAAARQAS